MTNGVIRLVQVTDYVLARHHLEAPPAALISAVRTNVLEVAASPSFTQPQSKVGD